VGGHPREMHDAWVDFDEEQDVEPGEEHAIDGRTLTRKASTREPAARPADRVSEPNAPSSSKPPCPQHQGRRVAMNLLGVRGCRCMNSRACRRELSGLPDFG
jgi:hypothetical protein